MDPSRITAVLRPRSHWESIDLGFALARTWFVPLWLGWWVTAAPLALLTLIPLHGQQDWWLLLLWWCKPAFEALPLYWLSRALFGERLPLRTAAGRIPQALPRRLWPQLAWRRLGVARSFTMPVTLLEAPRGPQRAARLRALRGDGAGWLTIICLHFEQLLWLSALLLLAFLLPQALPAFDLQAAFTESDSIAGWIGSLLALLAMSLIAPFYVAAGFALYLGRRTRLEAWDLELAFRRRQTRRPTVHRGASVAAALLLATALAMPTSPAHALTPEEARSAVDAVLADPDFGGTREEWRWVYVGDGSEQDNEDTEGLQLTLPQWLIQAIAGIGKWALLFIAAVALALLALHLLRELRLPSRRRNRPAPRQRARVEPRAGGTKAPLPLDIPGEVRRRLAEGDARGALALLYRAQIAQLRAAGLDLPNSATEAECLAATAAKAPPEQVDWLGRLLRLWQGVAYGHRRADPVALESLLEDRARLMQRLRGHA